MHTPHPAPGRNCIVFRVDCKGRNGLQRPEFCPKFALRLSAHMEAALRDLCKRVIRHKAQNRRQFEFPCRPMTNRTQPYRYR